MVRWLLPVLCVTTVLTPVLAADPKVEFVEADHRIDVLIGRKLVTSYIFPDDLPKPSLYPLSTPSGIVLTRTYPQRPDESQDHPHHVGIFFAADGTNGNAFWLNTARTPRIQHARVTKAEGGPGGGTLSTVASWMAKDGAVLLEEARDMQFRAAGEAYTIDFAITLKPIKEKVTFSDPKEAMFGIRVADWMREEFKAEMGVVSISGTGTGRYLSATGNEGEAQVWGRRAQWVRLEASKDGKPVGIAIFDHPQSVNHPTYWHARGYGLFAANPVGQLVFEKARNPTSAQPLNLTLAPGQSATFRYRVLVYDGKRTKEELDREFADFAK